MQAETSEEYISLLAATAILYERSTANCKWLIIDHEKFVTSLQCNADVNSKLRSN